MSTEPKKVWKYRFYMTKDCRSNDFEFERDDVHSVVEMDGYIRVLLKNEFEFYISNRYMTHWRLAEEKEWPEIPYTGRRGAY